jgi:hypothetical protein
LRSAKIFAEGNIMRTVTRNAAMGIAALALAVTAASCTRERTPESTPAT